MSGNEISSVVEPLAEAAHTAADKASAGHEGSTSWFRASNETVVARASSSFQPVPGGYQRRKT